MRRSRSAFVWAIATILFAIPPAVRAQLSGGAVFEIGSAATDVGTDEGKRGSMYGMGLGGSYTLFPEGAIGLVVGADILVRGFEINTPGRMESGAGVFDQSDLYLDQYIGAKYGKIMVGVYFEQRRIDRNTALGKIGFPATGIGAVVRAVIDERGRAQVQFSYANLTSGEFRLQGLGTVAPLDNGRSMRLAGQYRFADRWAVRAEYADTKMVFEPIEPTFGFYDHRQSLVSVGLVLTF